MGKFYIAFAWDKIVNLHACICKNEICIWSDPGVNLPIFKYTPVCICVRMLHCLPRVQFAYRSIFTRVYFWRMRNGLDIAHMQINSFKTGVLFMGHRQTA